MCEEKFERWVKRLNKLTGCGLENARKVAEGKLKYKENRIRVLEDRQVIRYSKRRASIISAINKQNPLRRIVNTTHANAILVAYRRHTEIV